MDFNLDNEQIALRDAVRSLLAASADGREKVVATEPGWDREVWGRIAEMGLLGLTLPEEYDGAGAGAIELTIVAQEIGRVLTPEPYLDVVAAAELVLAAGTDEQKADLLPRIASGETVAVIAHAEPRAPFGTTAYGVTATEGADGWTLSGVKEPVRHAGSADVLLVSADAGDQTRVFVVDASAAGVARTTYATPDEAYAARIVLDGAAAVPLGDAGEEALAGSFACSQVALAAEALGAMETAVGTTVEYLKTRKQFGVTLSKFQALTFRAADMYVSLELARSMVLWSTMSLAERGVDPVVASRVQAEVSRTARHIGQEAIQLHGGIGMTAEASIGHYSARLTVLERTLGTGAQHLAALTASVEDHGMVELLG
ncbi:hypothetical protein CLV56_1794 [Mumia flava]|uniref:Alkylation response protein AidB-like acyl-CoA dehydrogenase n=1 Tax=Mumia flava TaxID=1348852 RepID=A0A0B2BCU3_9ACTN|nr:acyl-CoA dehydrogenase family protein [Mumia flava]PJJ57559.1 hypothetical protein CLV56_1794 [Mumia flava]